MVKNEVSLKRIRSAQITHNHNQIGYAGYPRRAVASFPRFFYVFFFANLVRMFAWADSWDQSLH